MDNDSTHSSIPIANILDINPNIPEDVTETMLRLLEAIFPLVSPFDIKISKIDLLDQYGNEYNTVPIKEKVRYLNLPIYSGLSLQRLIRRYFAYQKISRTDEHGFLLIVDRLPVFRNHPDLLLVSPLRYELTEGLFTDMNRNYIEFSDVIYLPIIDNNFFILIRKKRIVMMKILE